MRFAQEDILGRSANRICVLDPTSDAHCLKYELPPAERSRVGLRQRLRRWLARRLPAFGENHLELRAWRWLQTRVGNEASRHIAACEGIVDTMHGPALRCELVRDADGQPARSLYQHLFEATDHDADTLCAAVDAFEAWLLLHHIPLFDLNSGNFTVIVDQTAAPGVRLVCVDVKSIVSGREFLPFSRRLPALRARKVQRRATRLRERIRSCLANAFTETGTETPIIPGPGERSRPNC